MDTKAKRKIMKQGFFYIHKVSKNYIEVGPDPPERKKPKKRRNLC